MNNSINEVKEKSTKEVSKYYDRIGVFKDKLTDDNEEQEILENNKKSSNSYSLK